MGSKSSLSFFGKAAIIFIIVLIIATIGANIIIHFYPSAPGYYDYYVKISGLSDYEGSSVTRIAVPIPSIGNESRFPDERFRYLTYGDWESFPVVTGKGKMLEFRSSGTTLTDIGAYYTKETDTYPETYEIIEEIFIPTGQSIPGTENTTEGCGYIIISDNLRPLSNSSGPISVSVKLTIHGGTTFGNPHLSREYQVVIEEQIPPGETGIIPVEPKIYYRDSISEGFRLYGAE